MSYHCLSFLYAAILPFFFTAFLIHSISCILTDVNFHSALFLLPDTCVLLFTSLLANINICTIYFFIAHFPYSFYNDVGFKNLGL